VFNKLRNSAFIKNFVRGFKSVFSIKPRSPIALNPKDYLSQRHDWTRVLGPKHGFTIDFIYDAEAGVWVVISSLPGLVVEAESIEELFDELRAIVPDLWRGTT
jgi:hypothetical protein